MRQSKQQFREYLVRKGLKTTKQREIILDAFLRASTHPSTEELFLKIRRKHPTVGYATVYRTLKLFADCGIAEERNFGDGQTRYEWTGDERHHDHLICTRCGAILEFEDADIEKLQQQVAFRHGFTIASHRLELYGTCRRCTGKS
ncbi:transcriptional repressor [Geothermobacter hydrogeniphilus]|uniref:Ferric uptake regulation protein n=1 Tax=Geothermobacter hydrogeniphilus TaxID=1969733 RepID=A0A1X0Y380_9BACT|nr:transcriptional repressor [Geothermobacter hydrogeniphilus]ORJ59558.1 transcriptional repressor [Geothermobacter hydrogeniphilus]PNU19752.1 transcriptional repressor [Geothermobacter hydrogeniphilus]